MNLIEKLGLEKCKQIVDGAPDCTADTYVADTDTYFSLEFGSYFDHGEGGWNDSDYRSLEDLYCDYISIFVLSELCKEIANHEHTDDCTDIKNHISPNTKVIER